MYEVCPLFANSIGYWKVYRHFMGSGGGGAWGDLIMEEFFVGERNFP